MNLARILAASLLFASSALAGSKAKLTLVIHHVYNGKPLEFAKQNLATSYGEQISVTRLSYLLAEPALQPPNESAWLTNRNWFGFADATRGDVVQELNGLPRQRFEKLRFYVGPDAIVDHADPSVYPPTHALNPLVNGLHWGWAGGFVYLAIEGGVTTRNGPSGYSFHIAGAPNRMEITLPLDIDLAHDTTVELDFHVDQIFAGKSPLALAEINSTHSRIGDSVATQIKTQIEQALTIRSVHVTAEKPLPAKTGATASLVGTPYRFTIPKGVPLPQLPADFPLTNERVALGEKLFHDVRLSRGGELSCASCHKPATAFADTRRYSLGVDKIPGERNAMSLCNLAWKKAFFWDGRAPSLRQQAIEPIQNPIEMHASFGDIVKNLERDADYISDFTRAFGTPEISAERIGLSLEAFVTTLTSFDSRFDRAMRGQAHLTEQEKRGFQLFVTEYDPRRQQFGADCFHCHGGALFTDNQFHNNGLDLDPRDLGRARVTKIASDSARFITPSLRNVALTAPYMHDGRFATLAEVIEHYDHGVRYSTTLDPNLAKHPDGKLNLSPNDKQALVAFLKTLTDERFISPDGLAAR